MKKSAKKAEKRAFNIKTIFALVLLAELIATCAFIVALGKINLLLYWQFALIVVIFTAALILNSYELILSKKANKTVHIVCVVIAILISLLGIMGFRYVRQASNFISDITGAQFETDIYEVRALKTSSYKSVDMLKRQHVGFLTTNPNIERTKDTLKNIVDYKATNYEEVGSMLAGIEGHSVAAVVINQSYLDFIDESGSTFSEDTEVIYSFEVRVGQKDIRQPVDVTTEPFILYISGSDARGPISQTARSDVNMLAVVNPKQGKILLVSIPRDYYVQLHGTTGTKDKLTHAGIYGIDMSKKTVEDLIGYPVNYTAKVGFNTVIRVVDAIDGIDIDSDQEFTAWTNKSCHFTQGIQHVGADCALAFSRERFSYSTGDRHRGQNQQQVITKIIEKVSNPYYLTRYSKILDATKGSFETSFEEEELAAFVRYQLSSLTNWQVESISVDGTSAMLPTYSMGRQKLYVMIPDMSIVDFAKQRIAEYLK